MAVGGRRWPSVAVGGRRWPSVAVGGRRWPSVAVGEFYRLVGIFLHNSSVWHSLEDRPVKAEEMYDGIFV